MTNRTIKLSKIDYDLLNDFLIVRTSGRLRTGNHYRLSIPFESELKSEVVGYYRSSYIDPDSEQRTWLSATQFQATHARRAFPCFDEPELKATFTISLGHHQRYNALSNMPLVRSECPSHSSNWVVDHFEPTVLMSSYLVAYTINDYGYAESPSNNLTSVVVRSWTRRNAIGDLRFANEIAVKLIDMYERKFELQFPLPKIDFITIPNMLFAAMENWGLVTFTEAGLEFSAETAELDDQHFVASVVAHEIAHMWFGNLVTMRWWTDLWLNEGFARYTEFTAIEYLFPEWRSMDEIVIEDVLEIFKYDALNSSHAVSITIGNPEEIPQLFDSISYKKGSAIVRMMHMILGDDTYYGGVARYLERYQFGNAEQDDLWETLTEKALESKMFAGDFNVKKVMDSWTLQIGYPVVYVKRDYEGGKVTLRQMRFLYDETIDDDTSCWWIPLTITTSQNLNFDQTQPQYWLDCVDDATITLTNVSLATEWIMLNNQMAGLYKVQYDYPNYRMLAAYLNSPNFEKINAINRAQLIDDALDLAWAGLQDYSIAFSLLNYLPVEYEYIPLKAALSNLDILDHVLVNSGYYNLFQSYASHLLFPIYHRLNIFQADYFVTSLGQVRLRKTIADWACSMDIGDCVATSLELFQHWFVSELNTIPLDLRSIVYCTAIRESTRLEWDFLWERYRDPNVVSSERFAIAEGLACTRDAELIESLLRWSVDEESPIRLEDTTVIFDAIAEQPEGNDIAKQFLFDNIDKMHDYVNPESFESRLASHVKVLAQQITTSEELKQLQQFVALKQTILAGNSIAIEQALEHGRINIQWSDNRSARFVACLELLKENGYDAAQLGWF
ncbi:aminopeptidase N-like isoform X2 [Toxorhynchites rutilus septentrionalis]|nr:aminopeptidase N-like isoform X2 [Toxorhynchites rutilus septentrionalis]